ncbi:MAG: hypothetical protein HY399_00795 [Elusimicrobia bacterium]|nr:hypothetical protein [Elusimicrobiota bacterium]
MKGEKASHFLWDKVRILALDVLLKAFILIGFFLTPSTAQQPNIPLNAFLGNYYDNADLTNLVLTRTDSAINFDWQAGSPDPAIGPDTFSVDWTGNWEFAQQGTYEFDVTSDDGIRVWIDGNLVFDNWRVQPPSLYNFQRRLSKGVHLIHVEYFENALGALAQVSWRFVSPDTVPPTVSLISPVEGATLSGSTTLSAIASDDLGVEGVQFKLDGVDLGAEDASAPYEMIWDTTLVSNGPHTLTAVAIDGARNTTPSLAVNITLNNHTISNIAVMNISSIAATISWTTQQPSDSQVEYGTSSSYGLFSLLDANLITSHSQTLSNLNPSTLYHFRIHSKNGAGDLAVSLDQTFMTQAASADTTSPTIKITSPANGATLSGSFTVSGTASDNVGVTSVEASIDGGAFAAATGTTNFSFSVPLLANGQHTITARTWDAAGNTGSDSIVITVNIPARDQEPPIVSIVSPSSGSTVSGSITVSIMASDNVGVTRVDLYKDGSLLGLGVPGSNPNSYTVPWNTLLDGNGFHVLWAKTYDAAGNVGTSAPNPVTVSNGGADTIPPKVTFLSPKDGDRIRHKKRVPVVILAEDNVAVQRIKLTITKIKKDGNPYKKRAVKVFNIVPPAPSVTVSYLWNAKHKKRFILTAEAWDTSNNGGSATLRVRVVKKKIFVTAVKQQGVLSVESSLMAQGNSGDEEDPDDQDADQDIEEDLDQEQYDEGSNLQAEEEHARPLLLSPGGSGVSQQLHFTADVEEVKILNLSGRELVYQTKQGGSIVISVQNAEKFKFPSGLSIIQMKISGEDPVAIPLTIVK